MKKRTLVFILLLSFCLAANAQIKINADKLIDAGKNAAAAVTLSDAQVIELCAGAVAQMDKENQVAPHGDPYAKRLAELTRNIKVDGLNLNYKVYLIEEINAFACGDGSVRVFSGLMDLMEDDELMAVIGHEIGHVAATDSKDAMRTAYKTAAARSAIGSIGSVSKFTDSQWADLAEAFIHAKYSRTQETEADAYAVAFCVANGLDPYAMSRALEKLQQLGGEQNVSTLQQWLSDHPDNAKRIAATRALADIATGKTE